jgi:hypothetical protein
VLCGAVLLSLCVASQPFSAQLIVVLAAAPAEQPAQCSLWLCNQCAQHSLRCAVAAGISVILGRLLAQLPTAVPATAEECKAALAASKEPMAALQQMLTAAAVSLADALLDR